MHKTFCVLPWYSKEISATVSPCCLLKPDYQLDQIKQDLLAGAQNPSCSTCWQIEATGCQSRRQQENIFLDYKLDRDLDKIQQDCENNQARTLLYQIKISNLCNQACVSCNSAFSSKWIELYRQAGITNQRVFSIDLDAINIDYQNAQRIELLGGEPLFDPKTFVVLEKLLEHNNTDCHVSLVTNGSISLSSRQKELFSKFANLSICVSIDGVGSVFEYMRWPGRWDKLLSNLKDYRSTAKNTSISYTISSLNSVYYNETVQWFESNRLQFNHNIVVQPQWLSLTHAPVEIKKLLSQQNNFVSEFAEITGQEISLEQYRKQILSQDTVKKIKIQDYLPEIAAVINSATSG